ncbi:DNA replication/repair protein RecF [Patescibacteria group bacterium]
MQLKSIQLENFRSYDKLKLSFDQNKNTNIFIGDNAQGKTNFLEAITILSLAKSFRASKHEAMIKWGADYARIKGQFDDTDLEFFVSQSPKKQKNLKKNDVNVAVKDFIGQLNVVLFHPEDLNMLYLSPGLRRQYINTVLSQVDPMYFDSLVQYNRLLKQRNKALFLITEGKVKHDELNVWDDKLAQYGSYIYQKRLELTEFFNIPCAENYHKISDTKEDICLSYSCSFKDPYTEKDDYLEALQGNRESDIAYQQTRKGIHRDDIEFFFNNKNINDFASRGEMRTLLISLKLTEIAFIEAQTGQKPILLLDDVFSELDQKRQKFLIEAISNHQSFITTTHHDLSFDSSANFDVEAGTILNMK